MRTFLMDLLAQMKGIWARLDGGQRLIVSVVLLATVVGLGAIVWFAGRPTWVTVYTANSQDEIDRATQALQQHGIAWTVDESGRGFQVERSKVGLANMAISAEGLVGVQAPAIGGGASLIEDAATKAWKLDAASRAAAVAAIQALEPVLSATVTSSRPQRIVAFRDRQQEQQASATIVLRLKPGVAFEPIARSAASIAASQLMVPLANIDVVSASGGQRWRYDPDRETGGGTSDFLALQRSISDERTRLAQEQLEQLWPGKIAVRVTVELDPTWEIRSEKVLPTAAIVRSEEIQKDSTDANNGKDADGKNSSKNETRNREFVTEIGERRTGKMMPETKRMSVAVLYDRSLESATGFNKDDLVRTVKAIVGWDPQRDGEDAFSTLVGEFAPVEPLVADAGASGFGELARQWGPTIGQVLGVFVVVLFLRGLFRGSARKASAATAAAAPAEVTEDSLAPEEQQRRMRREIERSIASDPAALAKMLEAWLMEQKA